MALDCPCDLCAERDWCREECGIFIVWLEEGARKRQAPGPFRREPVHGMVSNVVRDVVPENEPDEPDENEE